MRFANPLPELGTHNCAVGQIWAITKSNGVSVFGDDVMPTLCSFQGMIKAPQGLFLDFGFIAEVIGYIPIGFAAAVGFDCDAASGIAGHLDHAFAVAEGE